MAQQFCQGCGSSLMPTLRMCPTCGSKNLDVNPPLVMPSVTTNGSPSATVNTTTPNNSQLKGLDGWLILVGFGLILGIIKLIVSIISIYKPVIDADILVKLTNPNSTEYIPNFALLFYSEIIVNAFLVLMMFYLLYLFFNKKKNFPKNYIFISLFAIIVIPVDSYLISNILPNEKFLDAETLKSFFQSLLSGAIWIPYMLKSIRVRNTFIED
jgi:hypothetical protein